MSDDLLRKLTEQLEALNKQVSGLTDRLSKLEALPAAPPAPAPVAAPAAPAAPAVPGEMSEELLMAISAAVAAYMGVRAHIKAIRLVSSAAWAQQGRASIQGSHRINVQHHQHK
jgi:methylmalonyl-CoA carboxyltransferase large subunit